MKGLLSDDRTWGQEPGGDGESSPAGLREDWCSTASIWGKTTPGRGINGWQRLFDMLSLPRSNGPAKLTRWRP